MNTLRQRLRTATLSVLATILSVTPAANADDTSIYINAPVSVDSNILFVLDSSGSMTTNVSGSNQTRMDAVKEAMADLINKQGNLNMGLARFHYYLGAPIIFPVTALNSSPDFLSQDIAVATIADSADDAEEAASVVNLTDTDLDMTVVSNAIPPGAAVSTWESSPGIHDDFDDQWENGQGGGSVDIDMGQRHLALRFLNVAVPQNATILSAEIEFTADPQSDTGNAGTTVFGLDVDNAGELDGDYGSSDTAIFNNLAANRTSTFVEWENIFDLDGFTDEKTSTPNLREVVQPIVTRSGWASGNNMILLFRERYGNRTFDSYDDGVTGPKLKITYAESGVSNVQVPVLDDDDDAEQYTDTGNMVLNGTRLGLAYDDGHPQAVGVRFDNVNIPQGSTIVWADIRFTMRQDEGDSSAFGADADFAITMASDVNPPAFSSSSNDITGRSTVGVADVPWDDVLRPQDTDTMFTPDLSSLVNEVIRDDFSWSQGNALAFILKEAGTDSGIRALCSRDAATNSSGCPEEASAPILNLWYVPPSTGGDVNQTVGLRFDNVTVPQGATIESAVLEFTVNAVSTEPGTLNIQVEDSVNPASYSTSSNDISGRTYATSVNWDTTLDPWDTVGEVKQSVDISTLVDDVTNDTSWCGGNAMAFKITGTDTHVIADSWDKSPATAPVLRVEFDTSTLASGEGCVKQRTVSLITTGTGDIEEQGDGDILTSQDSLDVDDNDSVGLRFKDLQIPKGATVINANLIFSAYRNDGNTSVIEIDAQQHPNAPGFTDAAFDLSSRMTGTSRQDTDVSPVVWSESTYWVEGEEYSPADDGVGLSSLIENIIDGTVTVDSEQWAPGNALVFSVKLQNSGDDDRQISSVNINTPNIPKRPAELVIDWQANLGDVQLPAVSTRQALIQTINDIQPRGFTPTTDALFESLSYMESNKVHFGRTRGAGMSYEDSGPTSDSDLDGAISGWEDTASELLKDAEFSRLSHPQTYVNAGEIPPATSFDNVDPSTLDNTVTPAREGFCTEVNPNHPDCRNEHIPNDRDEVQYKSPFLGADSCEKGFLIVLSDGRANRNSSPDLIRSATGNTSCDLDIPEIDSSGNVLMSGASFQTRNPSSAEECGLEVSEYLYNRDYIPNDQTVNTPNNVKTFTIGFDLPLNSTSNRNAVEYLKALAFVGNGGNIPDNDQAADVTYGDGFFTASTADELKVAFDDILAEISDETTSFVAPGLAVNAFNRLFNRADVYFSLFQANEKIGWLGNVKKFKLCTDDTQCTFGEVIDENGNSATNNDETNLETFGTLKPEALGFWSESTDSAPEINQGGAGEAIPPWDERNVFVNLTAANPTPPASGSNSALGTSLTLIDDTSDIGPITDPLNPVKQGLVDGGNCAATDNDCLNDLIKWILGRGYGDDVPRDHTVDPDSLVDGQYDRWAFADPMHSRPLVLTFGIDSSGDPISKLFLGTNDGGLRMLNEYDGKEGWITFPNSMLGVTSENSHVDSGRQSILKDNDNGSHIYGIDDTPVARINDKNLDGIIDPADDFVHLYVGMRRGGDQLFAVNVTPNSTITTQSQPASPNIVPEILWRIDGNDADFSRLGQSWSTPRPARILGEDGPRTVLIFGGGYSTEQDGTNGGGEASDGGDVYNTDIDGDSEGNAIYIVDADTGERIWWASSDSTADTVVTDMNTSIGAPLTLVDSNGDSFTDRIYAVDLRGQVFRVDLQVKDNPGAGESELADTTAGLLARLGDQSNNGLKARRKFLYAPAVSLVNDQAVSQTTTGGTDSGMYELIGIVSGNRVNPQGKTVLDRAYAIRDYLVDEQIASDGSNFPACNPNDASCVVAKSGPVKHPDDPTAPETDLVDVTESSNFVIRDGSDGGITLKDANGNDLADTDSTLVALQSRYGWFFELEGANIDDATATDLTGEKGFSAASILDGKMFFTTYLPPIDTTSDEEACSAPGALGTSRLYAVDVFTGAPAFVDFDSDGDSSIYEKQDRIRNLGAGPSADVVPAYLEPGVTLVVPTGGAAVAQDPDLANRAFKSFWFEER